MTPNQLKARIAASAGEPKVMLSHAEAEGLRAALTPEGSPFPLRDKSMTETKFDPGPWKCDGNADDRAYGISSRGEGGLNRPVVVWRGIASPASARGRANARLIAAAPELYEACAEALAQLRLLAKDPSGNPWVKQLAAALAKARGEPQ